MGPSAYEDGLTLHLHACFNHVNICFHTFGYISCIYFLTTLTMNFNLLILCSSKLRLGKSDIFLRVSDEELRAGWHGNRDYSLTVIEPPPYLSGSHSLWQPSRHSRGRVGKKNSEERKWEKGTQQAGEQIPRDFSKVSKCHKAQSQ